MKAQLFNLAWKLVPKIPIKLTLAVSDRAADIVTLLGVSSTKQLKANLERLTGRQVTSRELRASVRSYFRAFSQQFSLPGWSSEYLTSSVTYPQAQSIAELLKDGPVVLALTHSGNWDLAGAWFCQSYGKIVTTAEKLEPQELFDKFVAFRSSIGMDILGVAKGEHVFEQLVQKVKGQPVLVPLLADRDISGAGIEVQLGTAKALVAAGPAALAIRLGRPLIAGHLTYKKEHGSWHMYARFTDPLPVPTPKPDETQVEALTKAWVKAIEPVMVEGFLDWHMMQKLYIKDLDPERLERSRARHMLRSETGEGTTK